MKINDFAKEVTIREGGKVNLSIAQVKEVLRITNALTFGRLYSWIRGMKDFNKPEHLK
jgi:hypothetical protein